MWSLGPFGITSDVIDPGPAATVGLVVNGERGPTMSDDQDTFTGGCRCGAIRYRAAGRPLYAVTCHCRHCQYDSGGGPAHGLVFAAEAVQFETGRMTVFEAAADSGNTTWRGFCPDCGTPLAGGSRGAANLFVKAGSLDDPTRFTPQAAIWTEAAPHWHVVDPRHPHFARNPPGVDPSS